MVFLLYFRNDLKLPTKRVAMYAVQGSKNLIQSGDDTIPVKVEFISLLRLREINKYVKKHDIICHEIIDASMSEVTGEPMLIGFGIGPIISEISKEIKGL